MMYHLDGKLVEIPETYGSGNLLVGLNRLIPGPGLNNASGNDLPRISRQSPGEELSEDEVLEVDRG